MARKVFVTSAIATDEALSEVADADPIAQLIWPWLLTAFDDWGRMEASARRLKLQVFPANSTVTVEVVEKALMLYSDAGLITLYSVDGKRYAAVHTETWFHYQTHIRQEKREKDTSAFPTPPRDDAQPREDSRDSAQLRALDRESQPSPSLSPSLSPSPSSGSSYEEPGRAQRRKKSSKSGNGPSLGPLVDAFRERSLPDPVFIGSEARAAQALLGNYDAALVAECWSDIQQGRYGSAVDGSNLSFAYLAKNNRIGNWRAWKDSGSPSRSNGHLRPLNDRSHVDANERAVDLSVFDDSQFLVRPS